MIRGHCGENNVAGGGHVGVRSREAGLRFRGALADLRGVLNIVGGDVLDAGLPQALGEMIAGFAKADESDSWSLIHKVVVPSFTVTQNWRAIATRATLVSNDAGGDI